MEQPAEPKPVAPNTSLGQALTSAAERQQCGAAGGIAINQGPQADLMQDALAGEAFGDHADHKAQHGGPAIEPLCRGQLLHVDLSRSGVLEPFVVGVGAVGHRFPSHLG